MDVTIPSPRNWEDLANAVCTQAIRDYEWCISDRPIPHVVPQPLCNLSELHQFFREQVFTELPLGKIAQKIGRIYKEMFRPYCEENYQDICYSWIGQSLDHKEKRYQREHHPFVCPSCGGLLRPEKKNKMTNIAHIVCTDCNLNYKMPDSFIKELNSGRKKV